MSTTGPEQAWASLLEQLLLEPADVAAMAGLPTESGDGGGLVESTEMRWLTANARALEAYRGEWLLIWGTELAAHSPNFREVLRVAEERGIRAPFYYYVPTPDEANFIAI